MADDVFNTEHASLSAKDFPMVVVKETAELSNDERAELLDVFFELLETGEPHSLILDLSEAGPLSDEQRIFIAESLQMRAKELEVLWVSVAILVASSAEPKPDLIAYWQSVVRVPNQAFSNMMSAHIWTRQELAKRDKGGDAEGFAHPAIDGEPRVPSRPPPEKPAVRSTRPTKRPPRRKNQPKSRSRVLAVALTTVVVGIALWVFVVPSSEAELFAASKRGVAMRAYKKAQRSETLIRDGALLEPKEPLRFEADIPARAFVLLIGVKPNGKPYVALPRDGMYSLGPITSGEAVRLPAAIELDETSGREWFHLAVCPEKILSKDCKVGQQGALLECPEDCVVKSLHVEKTAKGN